MNSEFESIFVRLRGILEKHSAALIMKADAPGRYSLEACAGPAAVQAWGGKMKRPIIPVAGVQAGKAYVSYHLMGVYGNTRLLDGMSKELKTMMEFPGFTADNMSKFKEKYVATGGEPGNTRYGWIRNKG